MKKNTNTIILAAGGTGGHLFPAISLASELIKLGNHTPLLVTDNRCQKYLPDNLLFHYVVIDLYINLKSYINYIKLPFQIIIAILKSIKLVKIQKPKLIIGFGGYPSFPMVLVAKFLSIPIILCEPNAFIGRVNRFFAKDAKLIISQYDSLINMPKNSSHKLINSGVLIRPEIKKQILPYDAHKPVFNLLVIGGSQGASFFNNLIPEAIENLLSLNPDVKIRVVQQVSGDVKFEIAEKYKKFGISYQVSEFFHDMPTLYNEAVLVICRSGASTITELQYCAIPAIYIPFPHAKDDHQYHNAKKMQELGYGWCYRQADVTPEFLANILNEKIVNRQILEKMSKNMQKNRQKDGSRDLANTVVSLIE